MWVVQGPGSVPELEVCTGQVARGPGLVFAKEKAGRAGPTIISKNDKSSIDVDL